MSDLWQQIEHLPPDRTKLLLDVVQISLDLGGIVEPTPTCDGINGLISLYRRDWFGAGISLISTVPYVGDLAKAGKFGRYARTINEALRVAAKDATFQYLLAPVLAKIVALCESLPYVKLPAPLRTAVDDIYRSARHVQRSGRVLTRIEYLTDQMLVRVFGSTQNIGLEPRKNMRTIVEFFDEYRVDQGDLAEWVNKCKGIDFHKPVEITVLEKGERVATYVEMSKPMDRRIGEWLVRERGTVSHRNLGLSSGGGDRQRWVLEVTQKREILSSSAASTVDHWTRQRPRQVGVPTHLDKFTGTKFTYEESGIKGGNFGIKDGEYVAGGGTQLFLPEAYKFLKKVAGPD